MRWSALGLVLLLSLSRVEADEFFENRIRPLLTERCYACHSEKSGKSKGGLKLDAQASILAGGDSGPAADLKIPKQSLILRAVHRQDAEVSAMPPDKPLTETQIRDLEKWIAGGAKFPDTTTPKSDPLKHWAFQPVRKPTVPSVAVKSWPRTDIDRFLLAKLEATKLRPAPDATPAATARRLSFALTGLPPSVEDLQFVEKQGIEMYVDRLLASPHFGERWARHWMDLVRYAESCGHEYDYEFEGAWRYRDYLVRAFNTDLPYDRFVREHVAGDLLPPRVVNGRSENLLATAWWALQEQAAAPVDLPNDEAERLDNQIDTLGKTFNALTVGCARCHDHKFDPMRTKEYYGLFGIAAASPTWRTWANGPELDQHAEKLRAMRTKLNADPGPMEAKPVDFGKSQVLGDFAQGLPTGWAASGYGEAVAPFYLAGHLTRYLPSYLRSPQFRIEHDHVDVLVWGKDSTVQVVVGNYQMIRDPIYNNLKKRIDKTGWHWVRIDIGRWKGQRAHVEIFTGKVDPAYRIMHTTDTAENHFALRAVVLSNGSKLKVPELPKPPEVPKEYQEARKPLEKAIPAQERFLAIQDLNGSDVPVYTRGDANKPKQGREPRSYFALTGQKWPTMHSGSGRRELAEMLASPDNPLTARVYVNRVWHHLFGRGLVPTVDNFGILGDAPSHPELLDYLADRFVHEHKWSLKKLIREMVLSHAYQIETGPAPETDANNRLLSRFPLRRLDAEAVRDAILKVSGTLDPKLGGPPIAVPHNLQGSGSDSGNNYPPSGPIDGDRRRSLYLGARRSFPSTFLDVFDKPAALNTFGRRDVSNVPTQALTLLNDPFVLGQAEAWGKRIAALQLTADERIEQMFLESLTRQPSPSEVERAKKLIEDGRYQDLALALINVKEFIHVP
ncbi:MAG: PSD1 and planctomycete cytochrome C domain-containing protein [Fimbriiglobus sp.]